MIYITPNISIGNIQAALGIWNEKIKEIFSLLSLDPAAFKGGSAYLLMTRINESLKAIGYSLLVLFFIYGLVSESITLNELKRPETGIRLILRFVLSKSVITYGLDFLQALTRIGSGISDTVLKTGKGILGGELMIPDEIQQCFSSQGILEGLPLFIVSLLACLVILVLSYVLLFTVYGRFFRIYILTAVAPLPLSAFASEKTQRVGTQFLKVYISSILEGIVIVLACMLYSSLAVSMPQISEDASASSKIWLFLGEMVFNMLILVGIVKGSDRLVREISG